MSAPELPYEVLGEIFVACLPTRDSDRLNCDNAPMLLCQVSSDWRQAALSEPRLWDTVVFPPSYDPRYARFIKDGGVQRWFDRTGDLWPLTFGDEPSKKPATSRIAHFVPIVRKYAGRLRSLSLVMTKPAHLDTLRRNISQDNFDQLQSISLCSGLGLSRHTPKVLPLATPFRKASKLSNVSFSLSMAALALPWSQITRISVESGDYMFSLSKWREILQTCPNLQQATLIWPSTYEGDWAPSESLIHPSLKSLKLVLPRNDYLMFDSRVYDLSLLSSAVTFLNLQHLKFDFKNGPRREIKHLLRSCREFQSTLRTLTFGWQGDADTANDAPVEASQFVQELVSDPGMFTSLERLIIPCNLSDLHDIVAILLSHPSLSVTVLVAPNRMATWMGAISMLEDPDAIKHRITVPFIH